MARGIKGRAVARAALSARQSRGEQRVLIFRLRQPRLIKRARVFEWLDRVI